MQTHTFGGLTTRVLGGTDGEGGGDGPVVVLLHGFGAGGDDLVPFGRELRLPQTVHFVFPAAPISFSMGDGYGESRAWWMIDMERLQRSLMLGQHREMAREVPEGLASAREKLAACLDEVERALRVPPGQMVLGGFSQGAMLSCDLALRASDRLLAGLVLLSGTLLAEQEWAPLAKRRAGLKVFMSHGQQDPLLPFAASERLRDLLAGAGASVEFVPFRGQHEIPMPVVARMRAFLGSVLTPAVR